MDNLDLSPELKLFYEKCKDNKLILSNDEIKKEITRWTSSYGTVKNNKFFKDNLTDFIFGFKNHVFLFSKKGIIIEVVTGLKGRLYEYTFDEIDFKIEIKQEHPTLELDIKGHKIVFLLRLKTKELID